MPDSHEKRESRAELLRSAYAALDRLEFTIQELSRSEPGQEVGELMDQVVRLRRTLTESVEDSKARNSDAIA